jgi:hypothetical protein
MWNKHGFASGGYVAPNPPTGAVISYYLPAELKITPEMRKKHETPVKITLADSSGQVIHTMYGPAKAGLNEAVWNLRYDGPKKLNFLPPRENEEEFFFDTNQGPSVLPGAYKVSVLANGKTETQTAEVQYDPRFKLDPEALRAQLKLGLELRDEVSALNEALNRLNSLHKQISNLEDLLSADEEGGVVNASYKPVLEQARALDKKIMSIQDPLYNSEIQQGASDDIHYLQRFNSRLQGAMRAVLGPYGEAPGPLAVQEANEVHQELETNLQQFNTFLNTEVAAFNKTATEHGSSTLFAGAPVQIKAGAGAAGAGSGDEQDDNDDDQ